MTTTPTVGRMNSSPLFQRLGGRRFAGSRSGVDPSAMRPASAEPIDAVHALGLDVGVGDRRLVVPVGSTFTRTVGRPAGQRPVEPA